MMDNHDIEETSLRAWPALQQDLYDGWILRFSRGYTKRANCVNPIYPSSREIVEKISYCEKLYQGKGLPTIFRITPFVSPSELDHVLGSRGYAKIDITWVLTLDLKDFHIQPKPEVEFRSMKIDEWLFAFCSLIEQSIEKHQTHMKILETIATDVQFGSLLYMGESVACGIGVIEKP